MSLRNVDRYHLRVPSYELSHIRALEAESVHIIREAVSESENPVLFVLGSKDSALVLRLAVKAFWPARLPFPVMHIDTGHNFEEVIEFRHRTIRELEAGRIVEETGPRASRNRLQTESLLTAIEKHRFDLVFGGARRDEEKARAKERVFSFRDEFGQWDPKNQRPELWSLYNARHRLGEHMRVIAISNWTELDVWQYISDEGIELPSVYFSHKRRVFKRDGMLMAESPFLTRTDKEDVFEAVVRFRTVGDMTCTGAFESHAATVQEIIDEVAVTRITERGASRADDLTAETAMEDRKKEGYF